VPETKEVLTVQRGGMESIKMEDSHVIGLYSRGWLVRFGSLRPLTLRPLSLRDAAAGFAKPIAACCVPQRVNPIQHTPA
jgi:hypothetical protein